MTLQARIIFFNVDHGDSILIELSGDSRSSIILIDTCQVKRGENYVSPAFEYLKQKGIHKIDIFFITHLHKDHFLGIEDFLDNLTIDKIYIPPFISSKSDRIDKFIIKKYRDHIEKTKDKTSDKNVNAFLFSLSKLIEYLSNPQNQDKIEEVSGKEMVVKIKSFPEIQGLIYLPIRKIKGVLKQKIFDENWVMEPFPEMNDASLAIMFEINKFRILFAGDSTANQWYLHKRLFDRDGVDNLGINLLKAPHHGSKHNNNSDLYDYFFPRGSKGEKLVTSANGNSHPHDELFELITAFSLNPYCTNLARQCHQTSISSIEELTKLPKEVVPLVMGYPRKDPPIPCQGNIVVEISGNQHQIFNETGLPCIYQPAELRKKAQIF